jgi:hypothetical protein
VVIKNIGDTNAVTALTVAVSPLGTLFEAPASVTAGLPLAAGDAVLAGKVVDEGEGAAVTVRIHQRGEEKYQHLPTSCW